LLRAVTTSAGLSLGPEFPWVSPNDNSDVPTSDAAARRWGHDREIRAALIRWLCTDADARALIDPRGIRLFGARIVGELNLNFVEVPFLLALRRCRIPQQLSCVGANIRELDVDGSWTGPINLDRLVTTNNVWLDAGLRVEGGVSLVSAKIGVDLICAHGSQFIKKDGTAFYADFITVGRRLGALPLLGKPRRAGERVQASSCRRRRELLRGQNRR
jgi:hypothetical protein